jgi:DNA-binding GntR family transcriptional regulator
LPKVLKLLKEPLARRAVHAIRDAIFAGEYLPGQRMVEEELAASLGVSRNVVREAFWQLEAQGLIQSDDDKGKAVASLSVGEMAELIPLRIIMESLAASSAARNITPEAAEALRRQAARFTSQLTAFSSYAEIDFELHEMIWQLSGNKRMAQMLDRIAGPMIALQARAYHPLLPDLIKKETESREGSHVRIVEAICSGSPTKARLAMQKHVLAFWQMWLKQASEDEDAGRISRNAISDAMGLLESLSTLFESAPKSSEVM